MVEQGGVRMSRRKFGATALAVGITLVMGEDSRQREKGTINSPVIKEVVGEVINPPVFGAEPPPPDALIYEESLFPDAPFIITPKHTTLSEENQKEGQDGWKITRPDTSGSGIFTSPSSALPGEKIDFHGASNTGVYDLNVYRLGWYGGKGGRLVYSKEAIKSPVVGTKTDSKTKTPMANWGPTHSLAVPDDWRSGIYMAVATGKNGNQTVSPFWVRSQDKEAPIIASAGLLTYDAYNNWNGLSLYGGVTSVSLDRPLKTRGGIGEVLPWDIAFLRYLERSGFDADYMADVDSHLMEDIYDDRKLIVMSGHHEYYTDEMRKRLRGAVNNETNIALFGSNPVYWKVRLEDSENGKNRIVVCYKNGGDPDKVNPTGLFRKLGNHEGAFFGVAYEQTSNGDDWVVVNPDHWVFEGTGMQKGDALKRAIGPEFDTIFENVPAGKKREILTESVVNKGPKQGHSYGCLVTHDSGAKIYTTGSLDWVYALDEFRSGWANNYQIPVDTRAQKIASNVLKELS